MTDREREGDRESVTEREGGQRISDRQRERGDRESVTDRERGGTENQ